MIKDKKENQNTVSPQEEVKPTPRVIVAEEEAINPFVEMYNATKRAILTIREDSNDLKSAPFFKTIAIDTGQFTRIIQRENTESEVAFPAIYIHFINIRYLVQQQRIGQGRATMRIRFILNTLNNQDAERECDAFIVFQKLNVAIQDAKSYEPALNERCNLKYFDMPTTTNMLQAYWVDYEVWFREASAFKYRDWVKRYLVMPPFTNHSDAPQHDKDEHGDHPQPAYEEATEFHSSVEGGYDNEKGQEEEKESS